MRSFVLGGRRPKAVGFRGGKRISLTTVPGRYIAAPKKGTFPAALGTEDGKSVKQRFNLKKRNQRKDQAGSGIYTHVHAW